MEHPKLTGLLTAAFAAVVLAGCGFSDPYQTTPIRTSSSHAPTRQTTVSHSATSTPADAGDPPAERNGTVPATVIDAEDRVGPTAARATPRAAVLRYTELYVNWTGRQLVSHQRELAGLSIGAARLQAQQAAATATAYTQLTADHVSDHGEIVSAQPGTGPAVGKWVIVTAERTTGTGDYQGLPAAVHVTYATVTHLSAGWVISQWAPQS